MKRTVFPADLEVVVASETWITALRPMSNNPDLIATGLVRRDSKRSPAGLLVDRLDANRTLLAGSDFAPLADWIAIAMPGGDPPADPDAWLRRLNPSYGQLLAILLVGFGPDRAGWRGWSIERGVVRPLAGLQIVGPELIRVSADADPSAELPHDAARWSRTIHAVGEVAFTRLRRSSVVVIGSSRTGSLAAGMLAALGVGRLGLVDGDSVESHNLNGMLLASEADIGENKAIVLARHIAARRSDLVIRASRHAFGSRYEEPAIGDADLIVTCVDRPAPRLRAAHVARQHLIPHLDIGTGVTHDPSNERQVAADVRLLLPQAGCVRCVGGVGDLAEAEYEIWAPPGALPRRSPEAWDARGRLGSLITLNAMAVATGIQSWLELLAGRLPASTWHRIRWVANTWTVDSGQVTADENCPICHGSDVG